MPEPQADPNLPQTRRVALFALLAGVVISLLKFGVFWLTNSVAVLSDALESLINVAAAGMVLYVLWLSNRPADRSHPYGHGKAEVLAVGLEGWLILLSGLIILFEAVKRLIFGNPIEADRLVMGWWFLLGIGLLSAGLAFYVYRAGRHFENAALVADGKHLMTDVASTAAVLVGLAVVHFTGVLWLDPLIAVAIAGFILFVSWKLLWQSVQGIMDEADPEDDAAIRAILDEEVSSGTIRGYHKVRYRHTGRFHWVDMHLQVPGTMSVSEGHEVATRIEKRIEQALGEANATAHVEPWDEVMGGSPAG
jgi:cation diffusion facilitator family transporter